MKWVNEKLRDKLHGRMLSDAERAAIISRLERIRIRRMLFGLVLISIGTFMPEMRPHALREILADCFKGTGYIPLLKLIEEVWFKMNGNGNTQHAPPVGAEKKAAPLPLAVEQPVTIEIEEERTL